MRHSSRPGARRRHSHQALGWTTDHRSRTRRRLRWGAPLFGFGVLVVITGRVVGPVPVAVHPAADIEAVAESPPAFPLIRMAPFVTCPSTRLAHSFTPPVHYLFRPYIVYRSRDVGRTGARAPRPGWSRSEPGTETAEVIR